MSTDALEIDGRDTDESDAHTLFYAAYSLIPLGERQPPEEALRLLHAAALAWARHLDQVPATDDDERRTTH